MNSFSEIIELFNKCNAALERVRENKSPTKEDEDLIVYFDLRLAEVLIADRFVDSKKLANIILCYEQDN